MRNLVIAVTLLVAGLVLVSCAGEPPAPTTPAVTAPPTPAPTTSGIEAPKLYANNCAVCHGEKRQGVSGLGPALTSVSLAKLSDAEVRSTILKGKSNTSMSGFDGRLSSEEIEALVQFIKRTSP